MIDISLLQRTLDDWRLMSGAPGVAAAIRVNGERIWHGSDAIPYPLTARFPIYSITKTLTAICVLRLHETGTLPITSAVSRWLPELPLPDTITLGHLLQHTSGLGDYGSMEEYHDAVRSHPAHPWSDAEFLEAVLTRSPLFAPGAGWSYSNIGYLLLRLILERVTGMSFRRCLDTLVVTPLGLGQTFVAEEIDDWASCVPGYGTEVTADGQSVDIRPLYHPGWCAPGVAVSTPEEATLIFDALFAGKLLRPGPLAMMLTLVRVPGTHPPAVTPSYGLGIMADPDSTFGASYGHGGGGPGYSLSVTVLPNSEFGRLSLATFVSISQAPSAQDAETELLGRLLGNVL